MSDAAGVGSAAAQDSGAAGLVKAQWIELFTNGATIIVLALWIIVKEGRPFSSVGLQGLGKVAFHALRRRSIGLLVSRP